MESTATGCKISIQASQIVAWVQTLMPQLPKRDPGASFMVGFFLLGKGRIVMMVHIMVKSGKEVSFHFVLAKNKTRG